MPVLFSKKFNVSTDKLEELGVLDIILDIDTRVFIDPALIELCQEPEFLNARTKIETYFSNIITLIKFSKQENDMYWKKADELLTFTEIKGTCIGYSKEGTSGNAIGAKLRKSILSITKDLITNGEIEPTLFELLGVFQENVGCDRISDLITFILYEEILEYTDRIVTCCDLPTRKTIHNNKEFNVCVNNYNDQNILLLPKTLVSALPIAECFDDIDIICAANERVRNIINQYFDYGFKKKITKKNICSLLQDNLSFREALLEAYKNYPKTAYDFNSDPMGVYIWCLKAQECAEKYPLAFEKTILDSLKDVETVTKNICNQYKNLIENNGLSALLYDENKKTKHESAAQLLFYGIADAYCTANDVDLSRECNAGRGPVDFKLSRGAKDKIVVEVKLTSNNQLIHGISTQVQIYMKQEKTQKAIYLIIDTGHEKALEKFIKYYNDLDTSTKKKIEYIIIDATDKPSASKA